MPMRRRSLLAGLSLLPLASRATAQEARPLGWDELIPEGVPYSEIVADGVRDEAEDRWLPIFDVNAYRFVEALDGVRVRMPGFLLPMETGAEGVTAFLLTPYAGACIHVPPPPPNQLVFVRSAEPYEAEGMFDPIWVTGTLTVNPISTDLAEVGYALEADGIEPYLWD